MTKLNKYIYIWIDLSTLYSNKKIVAPKYKGLK